MVHVERRDAADRHHDIHRRARAAADHHVDVAAAERDGGVVDARAGDVGRAGDLRVRGEHQDRHTHRAVDRVAIEAFGGVGVLATTPVELRNAMEDAIRSRKPTLINAVIDEKAGTESGRITSLNPAAKKKP